MTVSVPQSLKRTSLRWSTMSIFLFDVGRVKLLGFEVYSEQPANDSVLITIITGKTFFGLMFCCLLLVVYNFLQSLNKKNRLQNFCCRFHHSLADLPLVTTFGVSGHCVNDGPIEHRVCQGRYRNRSERLRSNQCTGGKFVTTKLPDSLPPKVSIAVSPARIEADKHSLCFGAGTYCIITAFGKIPADVVSVSMRDLKFCTKACGPAY